MNATSATRHSGTENAAAYLITFPYLALIAGARMTNSMLQKALPKAKTPKSTESSPANPKPASTATATPSRTPFVRADQVHSEIIRGLTVCFYHYERANEIKIKARSNGFVNETIFTPADATAMSLPFTLASSVKWFRVHGFTKKVEDVPVKEARQVTKSSRAPEAATAADKPAAARLPAPAPVDGQPVGSKRPFTGKIVDFGPTTRQPAGGKPYSTYFLALENDVMRREFIGEQLAELVQEHNLQPGESIRLHPLGKRHFQVEVNGKFEDRTRNEYALQKL